MFGISLDTLNNKKLGTSPLSRSGSTESSPLKKKWREILRPNKSYSIKQTGHNASYTSSRISPVSDTDKTPFPPMSVQEQVFTPQHLSPPKFESSHKFEKAYNTPNTTPKSVNLFETSHNKSSDSFSYAHQVHTEGLNLSFANILNNNIPHLNKRRESQTSSTKNLDNTCFICSELLLNVLQSERVLKLNCGDVVHFECFKTAYNKELAGHRSCNKEFNLELSNLCHGTICKGECRITIDNRNLNSLLKRSHMSLTPKRPAPNQPKSKDLSHETKLNSQSINFKALKSTLNQLSHIELSRRSSVRNRDTILSSIQSPSPVNTIPTTITDSYNLNGFDNNQSAETVVNQLMQYLLNNCTTLNLAKLSQLGMLRVADQLQIKIEDVPFQEKYCYLFENSVVIWDKISLAIFIPVKNVEITCKGSIVTITPAEGNVLHFSLQSHLSSVIEKWAIVLMDLSVDVPGCKITNTIDLIPKVQEKNVFGGFLGTRISPIMDLPHNNAQYQLVNVSSHSVISTDSLNVKDLNLLKTNTVLLLGKEVDDSDSDADSDKEVIQQALKYNTDRINLNQLQTLISEVDQML